MGRKKKISTKGTTDRGEEGEGSGRGRTIPRSTPTLN